MSDSESVDTVASSNRYSSPDLDSPRFTPDPDDPISRPTSPCGSRSSLESDSEVDEHVSSPVQEPPVATGDCATRARMATSSVSAACLEFGRWSLRHNEIKHAVSRGSQIQSDDPYYSTITDDYERYAFSKRNLTAAEAMSHLYARQRNTKTAFTKDNVTSSLKQLEDAAIAFYCTRYTGPAPDVVDLTVYARDMVPMRTITKDGDDSDGFNGSHDEFDIDDAESEDSDTSDSDTSASSNDDDGCSSGDDRADMRPVSTWGEILLPTEPDQVMPPCDSLVEAEHMFAIPNALVIVQLFHVVRNTRRSIYRVQLGSGDVQHINANNLRITVKSVSPQLDKLHELVEFEPDFIRCAVRHNSSRGSSVQTQKRKRNRSSNNTAKRARAR